LNALIIAARDNNPEAEKVGENIVKKGGHTNHLTETGQSALSQAISADNK
jgi:hypothetical protein